MRKDKKIVNKDKTDIINTMKFIYKTINPKIKEETPLFELLNALAILEHLTWKQVYGQYIMILHTYGNGPSEDEKNMKCLLHETGYTYNVASQFKGYAIVKRQNHFYAMIQEDELVLYGIVNPKYLDPFEEYEIYLKDFKRGYQRQSIKNHNTYMNSNFTFTNSNPFGNLVQDCSIRALSIALKLNWHETLDVLAGYGYKMNQLHLNHVDVVEKVLKQYHFIKHKHLPYRLNVLQFCEKIKDESGPILLYAGKNHITVLVKQSNGFIIKDAWDCSSELAGDYFILEQEQKEEINYLDTIIEHPTYGQGLIYKVEGNKLFVSFDEKDCILMKEWVDKNCKTI